jgi:hypothetical protein
MSMPKCLASGYTLTGFTKEQCLFFLYGLGRNGKSVFLEIITRLMGVESSLISDLRSNFGCEETINPKFAAQAKVFGDAYT